MRNKSVFKIGNNKFAGFSIRLQNANLVLIAAKKGYIMCGYLNLKIADKFNDAACIVRGVSNTKDMLSKNIEDVSKAARILGIKKGMPVQEALLKLS